MAAKLSDRRLFKVLKSHEERGREFVVVLSDHLGESKDAQVYWPMGVLPKSKSKVGISVNSNDFLLWSKRNAWTDLCSQVLIQFTVQ